MLLLAIAGGVTIIVLATVSIRGGIISQTRSLLRVGLFGVASTAGTSGPAQVSPILPTQIGINITSPNKARAFANLALPSVWVLQSPGQPWRNAPPELLTATGELKSIPQGSVMARPLVMPNLESGGVDIICRFSGKGEVVPGAPGGTFSMLSSKSNSVSFRWLKPNVLTLNVRSMDPAQPIRNLDCRSDKVPATARFEPEFVEWMRKFKVLRYMDWQNTNANLPVSWENRHTRASFDITENDGVSVEDIVDLANQADVDIWVTVPWNTDDTYVRNFALYVRDHLTKNHRVYVELSNEVWNWSFSVAKQASKEGLAEGLSQNPAEAAGFRYAERLSAVMNIWAGVFAESPGRLIRVASSQHVVPARAQAILAFRDTARHVDALATAPYFTDADVDHGAVTAIADVFARLQAAADQSIRISLQNKAVAARYGKRYIAYESGQGVAIRNIDFAKAVQRDARMYDLYISYIDAWRAKVGDTLMMFGTALPIGSYGAWGLVEFPGQSEADAPKLRAVNDELKR